MKLFSTAVVAVVCGILGITAGCINNGETKIQPDITTESTTEIMTEATTESTATPTNTALSADADFAMRLNELMPDTSNYMFSPISIKYALAMTANGADGQTKQEILDTLGIENLDEFNTNVQSYMKQTSKNKGATLNIANAVWVNEDRAQGAKFKKEFTDIIKNDYNGEAKTVDNKNAVKDINAWCSKSTNGKIDEIIEDANFVNCLTNAVYFKGKWENEFKKERTKPLPFTDRNGNTTETDFMQQKDDFRYMEEDGVKMLALPYADSTITMYVILSDDKPFDFEDCKNKLSSCEVNVKIPKFKSEFGTDLTAVLEQLGIKKALNINTAEFTNMLDGKDDLYISQVLHKTYIDVNEEGTEAAAATAVMQNDAAEIEKIYDFIADKPFTYIIEDNSANEILFMGEYAFVE
jgi:serpin B